MARPRKKSEFEADQLPAPAYAVAMAKARKDRELSQEKFGEMLGRSQQAVTTWETGERNVPPELWPRICRILDISPELFFKGRAGTGDPADGLEGLVEEHNRRLFRQMHNDLLNAARETGVALAPADFAYILHNMWTRALLLDEPPTLAERVDVLVRRQRQVWQARND